MTVFLMIVIFTLILWEYEDRRHRKMLKDMWPKNTDLDREKFDSLIKDMSSSLSVSSFGKEGLI